MKQNSWDLKPRSFADTVQRVENYVRAEIAQETIKKQLCYHTINHALAVRRRANLIFESIKPILAAEKSTDELERLKYLIDVSAIAHDLVQELVEPTEPSKPRKHLIGVSEAATAKKLIEYIKNLNLELITEVEPVILFSQQDMDIIEDAILATICARDPQAGKVSHSFSPHSIYQPYLYSAEPKVSIVGSIIALADLGTLAIDGVESYIQDGILIFLEDNLDLISPILNWHHLSNSDLSKTNCDLIKTRLINMTQFMLNLAKERYARLNLEIASFTPQVRQVLKEEVFTYLNPDNIKKVEAILPTDQTTPLSELIDFFTQILKNSDSPKILLRNIIS